MKKYLLAGFIVNSILPSLLIMSVGYVGGVFSTALEMLLKSFFIGGITGTAFTYYYFNKRNYWILFDNLRINKYYYLGIYFLCYQFCTIMFSIIMDKYLFGT